MENNKTLYVVQLQYLGEPSVELDDQIEEQAFLFGLRAGLLSWDEKTFIRDFEFSTSNLDVATRFSNQIQIKYNRLCHSRIEIR